LCVFVAISPSYAATELKDEGTHKGWVTSIDCTGAGIDCSASGVQGTINVPVTIPETSSLCFYAGDIVSYDEDEVYYY